nr:hypothetical protein [Brucella anthropi]
MTIPVVKTAIAPSNGMPAHPAPSAKHDNISAIPLDAGSFFSYDILDDTSLIQIYTNADVLFYTDEQDSTFIPNFGIPLTAGGYFSYSVETGCTLHFSSDNQALIYILEG